LLDLENSVYSCTTILQHPKRLKKWLPIISFVARVLNRKYVLTNLAHKLTSMITLGNPSSPNNAGMNNQSTWVIISSKTQTVEDGCRLLWFKYLVCSSWFMHPGSRHQSWELPRCGFYSILLMVLRLRPGGLLIGGPPCGSFVWINRATSLRSRARILGDTTKSYIRAANAILWVN